MIHPDSLEIANYLQDTNDDLHAAGLSRFFVHLPLEIRVTAEDDNSVIDPDVMEGNLDHILSLANIVALEPPSKRKPTLHVPLAMAASAMARRRLTREIQGADPEEGGCLMAELRLVRALEFHRTNQQPEAGHRPGAVLFDEKGVPFAYQKSSGDPTAFAWRDAVMVTGEGRRFLPSNSFFELGYEDNNPLERYVGAGLISLADAAPPDSVAFVRFSTTLIPPKIAYYGLLGATQRTDERGRDMSKLRENIDGALALSASSVESQVHLLLRQDYALPVTA